MDIKAWRAANTLSQLKAAEILGISQPNIARIERGQYFPGPETIRQLNARSDGKITAEGLWEAWCSKQPERAA